MTTLASVVAVATRRLAAAGVPSPRWDAEELVAYVAGVPRSGLAGGSVQALDAARLDALLARRAAREPLQHIVGTAPFRYLEVAVGPGVFVPRPETELVAGWVVDALRGRAGAVVVDLCTGSAAIALAVATEVPATVVHAVEIDPDAVAYAQRNVAAHAETLAAAGSSVLVVAGDAGTALGGLGGAVDVVVANPPYLPDGVPMEPEVAEHDPARALFGGPDGLAGPRLVVGAATRLLRSGGLLAVEHDASHGPAMRTLLADGWADVRVHPDLAGRERFTTAARAR